MIGLAIAGIILWAIAAVFGKKAAAWVVLIVCTVLVFAIALVIGRHPAVNQFGDPVFQPAPAAAVNQFGDPVSQPAPAAQAKPTVGDAFDQIQPDKFTPPPLSSHQKPALCYGALGWVYCSPPAPAGGNVFDRLDAEQKAQAGAGKLGAIK
jgi:hypothetical protein